MGNSFICSQFFHDIKLSICYQNNCSEKEEEEIIDISNNNYNDKDNKENKGNNHKYEINIQELKNYFNEKGYDTINNNTIEKPKKHLNKKKHINALNKLSDNKYELMLKRLLEQKNVKRKGPKRRETIRKEKKIKNKINEVILDNTRVIQAKKNNNNKKNDQNQENEILIKNINIIKLRSASTSDKNAILINNNVHLNQNTNNLQHLNTINEIINESSGYSGLYKKKTTQSNSPQNKRH